MTFNIQSLYRVMVEGEDHTLFCFEDNVTDGQLESVLAEAIEQYPCAKVWTEEEQYPGQ